MVVFSVRIVGQAKISMLAVTWEGILREVVVLCCGNIPRNMPSGLLLIAL
jgi:hypothetical protein